MSLAVEFDPAASASNDLIERALSLASEMSTDERPRQMILDLAGDLRWMIDSRARWMEACERQSQTVSQLRAFDAGAE